MYRKNWLKWVFLGSLVLGFAAPLRADDSASTVTLPKTSISFGLAYFSTNEPISSSGGTLKTTYLGPSFDIGFRVLEDAPLYLGAQVDFMMDLGVDIGIGSTISKHRFNLLPYAVYRFQGTKVFTPFVGLGVGVSHFWAENGFYPSATSFLVQTKMGFDVGRKWAFRFEPSLGVVSSQFVFAPRFAASISW